jgi:glutathione S-transferase
MHLLSGPLSMFGAKAEIALLEKGADFTLMMVPFDTQDRYAPKHPDVVRINPKQQVPVLIDGDLELYDSTQIFEYLEDRFPAPALWPADPRQRARARLIEHTSDEVLFPPVVRLMALQGSLGEPDAKAAIAAIEKVYHDLERSLGDRAWLAGPFGFADIAVFMAQLFAARKGGPMTAATPKLLLWRARMLERPAVRRVAGRMARFLAGQGRPVPDFVRSMLSD